MGYKGLKELRKSNKRTPEFFCANCNCKRYSPCTCKVKVDTNAKTN